MKKFYRIMLPMVSICAAAAAGVNAERLPSLEVPHFVGKAERIGELARIAGPDWREVAEKNRTTGLEKLYGGALAIALAKKVDTYIDPRTQSVGKVPLAELGEIAEAAFRGGVHTDGLGWALWKNFFLSNVKVDDPVTAARLLAGFDRGLAGVVPKDANGDCVAFSPCWILTPFQTGTYRTTLPGGGYFESAWSNSMGSCTYELRTSAKKITCRIRYSFGLSLYGVDANGEEVDLSGGEFEVEPDKNGCVQIIVKYLWAGSPRKNKGKAAK